MKNKIDKILEKILILIMGIMVINVLWQVASRYLVNSPSIFTDELAGFLLIWVGLLGSGYAVGQHGLHLAIDIFPASLKGKQKRNALITINLLVAVFALLIMVIGGGRLVYLTFHLEQLSSALEIPLGYVYSVLPLSGVLMIYYSLYNIFNPEQDGSN